VKRKRVGGELIDGNGWLRRTGGFIFSRVNKVYRMIYIM